MRTVASTQSEMTEIILPNDTNTLGNLLGGRLMHFIDLTGAMAAYRQGEAKGRRFVRAVLRRSCVEALDVSKDAEIGEATREAGLNAA